jgi:hypothetical protein
MKTHIFLIKSETIIVQLLPPYQTRMHTKTATTTSNRTSSAVMVTQTPTTSRTSPIASMADLISSSSGWRSPGEQYKQVILIPDISMPRFRTRLLAKPGGTKHNAPPLPNARQIVSTAGSHVNRKVRRKFSSASLERQGGKLLNTSCPKFERARCSISTPVGLPMLPEVNNT